MLSLLMLKKIKVTGQKETQKTYYKHSGFPGGLKSSTFADLLEKNPEEIIKNAVKGMLPKNKLANDIINKLKVYKGNDHPHQGQNPIKMEA